MSDERCCVQSCLRRPRKKFLYPFPTDPVRKEIWRDKLKVKRFDVTQLVVCGLHFKTSDFKPATSCETFRRSRRAVCISLNATAVPSKNLPTDKGDPTILIDGDDGTHSPTSNSSNDAKKRRFFRRCLVPWCPNRQTTDGTNITLFAMPLNAQERRVWKRRLQIEHLQAKESWHVVCHDHFNYTDFYPGGKKLKINALPTLNPKYFVQKRMVTVASDDEQIDNESTKKTANETAPPDPLKETAPLDTEQSGDVVVCNGDNFVISFLN